MRRRRRKGRTVGGRRRAPWSGGPFSWLDIIGAARAVDICRGLTAQFGPRFHAPALLREMAEKGESFYARFGGEKAAA